MRTAQNDLSSTSKRTLFDDMTRNHPEAAFVAFPQNESSMRKALGKEKAQHP